jgi:predicted Na+-dependent transporter
VARLRPSFDNFTFALIAVVFAASLLPAHGQGAPAFDKVTDIAIGPALLPLTIFHQIQRMVCAVAAPQYVRRGQVLFNQVANAIS